MKKIIFLTLIALYGVAFMTLPAAAEKSADAYLDDLSASNEENVILKAADWAGEKKEEKAMKKLVRLVTDSRANVRIGAIVALGLIGEASEGAVDVINRALTDDQNADVRYAAVLAITRLASKSSISFLKTAREKESDPYVKDFITKMEERLLKK